MNLNPPRTDWFFPIEEAPVLVTVTHKGASRDVRVPHKKAIVAADTGHIVGIVGAGYKVFTNQQAVTLCHKFCLEAFPDTAPAEWTLVEGHGPGTRSWAAMDIHHRSHAMNLLGISGGSSEIFTPFVRITNSYNGSRALRIDVGFLREQYSNGVIFEQETTTLMVPPSARNSPKHAPACERRRNVVRRDRGGAGRSNVSGRVGLATDRPPTRPET